MKGLIYTLEKDSAVAALLESPLPSIYEELNLYLREG